MKKMLLACAAIAVLGVAANAEPVKLSKAQMDQVVAGKITETTTHVNGGGNTPKGGANGVPTVTVASNPSGHQPPGQN